MATAVIQIRTCIAYDQFNCAFDSGHPEDRQLIDRTISLR
jgi:hypothetical protein